MYESKSVATADAYVVVVIVNYRTPHLTRDCLLSLEAERELLPNMRVLVVDGGSGDGSAELLARTVRELNFHPWVSLLPLNTNGGFGWANNQAILSLAREEHPPEFVHLLNPDTKLNKGAIAFLVQELLREPRCGAAGSQLMNADGSEAASAFRFPSPGRELTGAAHSGKLARFLGIEPIVIACPQSAEVDWVTGASVLIRSEALKQVGLFDDGFFLYFEEVELMHRLRERGWTVRHVPCSRVFHLEGAATGLGADGARPYPKYWYESRRRYFALTGGSNAVAYANLGWLVGRIAALPKSIMLRRPTTSRVRLRDLIWLSANGRPITPSTPTWGDSPGRLPQWMAQ